MSDKIKINVLEQLANNSFIMNLHGRIVIIIILLTPNLLRIARIQHYELLVNMISFGMNFELVNYFTYSARTADFDLYASLRFLRVKKKFKYVKILLIIIDII